MRLFGQCRRAREAAASSSSTDPKQRAHLPLGKDSLSARVLRHPLVVLGGPRALLLELAHPAVADAVARYSSFETEPVARLTKTLEVMGVISFGPPRESRAAAANLRRLHGRIRGSSPGTGQYSANDPDLLMWVHATLVDTVLVVERRYLGLLSDDERAAYYLETRLVGQAIGIPASLLPVDLAAFEQYMSSCVESLVVGDTARRLARSVLHPRLRLVASPLDGPAARLASGAVEAITADLLPVGIRHEYGLDSPLHEAASAGLGLGSTLSRAVAPRVPDPILRWLGEAGMSVLLGVPVRIGA